MKKKKNLNTLVQEGILNFHNIYYHNRFFFFFYIKISLKRNFNSFISQSNSYLNGFNVCLKLQLLLEHLTLIEKDKGRVKFVSKSLPDALHHSSCCLKLGVIQSIVYINIFKVLPYDKQLLSDDNLYNRLQPHQVKLI